MKRGERTQALSGPALPALDGFGGRRVPYGRLCLTFGRGSTREPLAVHRRAVGVIAALVRVRAEGVALRLHQVLR